MSQIRYSEKHKNNLLGLNDKGTVTVLIPTYRRSKLLKRAVESVLNQTYSNLKIIVSDNASYDDTKDVMHGLMQKDERISLYLQDKNIGMDANFNFLFSKVETEFFCLLTDDDYYLDNFLHDVIMGFKGNNMAMFSVLSSPTITESREIIGNQLNAWPHEGLYKKGEATFLSISGSHPILTSIVFRREILKDVAFLEEYGAISDIPMLVKIAAKHDFFMSRKIGGYFIQHPGSISHSPKDEDLLIKERLFLINKYSKWFNNGFLTEGNEDEKKIAKIILRKKVIILLRMTKRHAKEAKLLVDSIDHPVKYFLRIHLLLVNVQLYINIVLFFRRVYISAHSNFK